MGFSFFLFQDGAFEQQPGWPPQLLHVPSVDSNRDSRGLAAQARQHRVREVPRHARHRDRGLPHARLPRRPHRCLLPSLVASLGLPPRHVRPYRPPLRLHYLRFRCYQQRRWQGCLPAGL